MRDGVPEQTLREMRDYYRARAAEYDEWFYRRGRYDRGPEANARWFADAEEVFAALAALHITGDVLELAPGTGIWTARLVQTARSITAVDASPEMVAINRAKVASDRVSYVIADLFAWRPERTYDAVVFGFWLSHVPDERLDAFWQMVAAALRPGGTVFFVDSRREQTSTAADHELPDASSQVMTRRLNNGAEYRIVKNFPTPAAIEARCATAGLAVTVRETPTYFQYGIGTRPS
jgi:demethylmenaquinone methyltransferase/2-methoxy-6-polyprenyl-1,4-benzoquinol methylase